MIKKVVTAICLFAGLLPPLSFAQKNTATEAPTTFSYHIELNAPAAQHKLIEGHLDLYRWRDNPRMDEVQLKRLVRLAPEQLRELLAIEGFYSPQISTELIHQDNQWVVKLLVVPGTAVLVSQLDLQVNGAFANGSKENQERLKKMRADWPMRSGAVFRHAEWESAKRNALKNLLLDTYPAATIADSQATVDPKTQSAALKVILDSGPAFTFGPLAIQGLKRYPPSLIERINPITPGEPYAQSKLLTLQSRLQDSPYFANATVSMETNPEQPLVVPVQVSVVENQSKKLGFGIGVSTDTGARTQVNYRDINLLDRTWRLGSTLKLDQKVQSVSSDLQFPLRENGGQDSLNALLEREDIEGVENEKMVLGGKRSFTHGKTETSYGFRYIIENQNVDGRRSEQHSTLSPSYIWTLRDVDKLLFPTRGYLLNFQADVAARALLSDQDFLRTYGRMVYFHPLGHQQRNQLILRAELGMVAASSRNGIPSDILFRTGGDQTIRGYAFQSLGVPESGGVVGGRYLAVASIEYVHWLTPNWGTALFVDGGNAGDVLSDLKPVYGYGAGARWKSPVGPLNLDVAYGQKTQEIHLHFSMGFSF
jgi:translocation and assembly module TamA